MTPLRPAARFRPAPASIPFRKPRPSPEQIVQLRARRYGLTATQQQLLAQLPLDQQRLWMLLQHGVTQAQAARELDVPLNTIFYQLRRLREVLEGA